MYIRSQAHQIEEFSQIVFSSFVIQIEQFFLQFCKEFVQIPDITENRNDIVGDILALYQFAAVEIPDISDFIIIA